MIWRAENRNPLSKTCSSDSLSKAKITENVPGSNPGSRSDSPATNLLKHVAAFEGRKFK